MPVVIILYSSAATWLAIYGLHVLILVVEYWRHRHDRIPVTELASLPSVTVQLPMYNEPAVAERVIDAIAELEPALRAEHVDQRRAGEDEEAQRILNGLHVGDEAVLFYERQQIHDVLR